MSDGSRVLWCFRYLGTGWASKNLQKPWSLHKINLFFAAGAIAPLVIWLVQKAFLKQRWISLINMPVLLGATAMMPPASSVNYTSWLIVAFFSGFVVFRWRPKLWERYNYGAKVVNYINGFLSHWIKGSLSLIYIPASQLAILAMHRFIFLHVLRLFLS